MSSIATVASDKLPKELFIELFPAVFRDDRETVEVILADVDRIKYIDDLKRMALISCISVEMLKLFKTLGIISDSDLNIIEHFSHLGRLDIVKYLLDENMSVENFNKIMDKAFMAAVKNGKIEIVKYILTSSTPDHVFHKDSALVIFEKACKTGFQKMVKTLLDAGLLEYIEDSEIMHTATIVARRGNLNIVRELFGRNIVIEAFNVDNTKTPYDYIINESIRFEQNDVADFLKTLA